MDSLDERLHKLNLSSNKYPAATLSHLDANEIVQQHQQQQHQQRHHGSGAVVVDSIPGGKVTHLVQQLQQQHQTANDVLQQQQQHHHQPQQQLKGVGIGGLGGVGGTANSSEAFQIKKVGPLVPPKPNKKKPNVQTLTYHNNKNNNININENVENTQECLYETAASVCSLPPTTTALAKGKLINSNCSSGNDILNSQQQEHEQQQPQPLQHHGRAPHLLHCKAQTLCTAAGSNCTEKSFNSKITLDIPIVLDQQLEALTHHKMQLEKRGLLQQQQQSPQWKQTHKLQQQQQQQQQQQLLSNNLLNNIPKLSSTSLLAKDSNVGIYTNLPAPAAAATTPTTGAAMSSPTTTTEDLHKQKFKVLQQQQQDCLTNCYTNLPLQQQQQLYTNLLNHQQQSKNPILTTLPTVKTLHLADLSSNSAQQLIRKHNIVAGSGGIGDDDDDVDVDVGDVDDDDVDDEEIPPPPSPVSSSYSELRRATTTTNNTNLFNIMPTVATTTAATTAINQQYTTGLKQLSQQPQTVVQQQQQQKNHYALDSSKMQNPYMNIHYNNDYNNSYSPTLQSLSQTSTDYYGYSSFSQGTSTYESIYEPINLRPTSQMSLTHSNNSLAYGSCSGGGGAYQLDGKNQLYKNQEPYENRLHQHQQNAHDPHNHSHHHHTTLRQQQHQHQKQPAEAEVEALSDFLVHSMQQTNKLNNVEIDDADDVDEHEHNPHDENYGICHKCNERILGETSGCTAMDQTYHIACFTCSQCQSNLQGKPFYALDGKPYCEYDYLQTLEKCSVCMKPILERILRATGKPYHPQCFTCIVCNKSLDGIPFTVDATNQNYCIADFHKKFAPRCCVCKEPIMPAAGEEETVRVVALDRSFHFECYKCEDCGLLLSSEADGRGCYPLDDHVLCKSCNANRVQMLTNRMTTEL